MTAEQVATSPLVGALGGKTMSTTMALVAILILTAGFAVLARLV